MKKLIIVFYINIMTYELALYYDYHYNHKLSIDSFNEYIHLNKKYLMKSVLYVITNKKLNIELFKKYIYEALYYNELCVDHPYFNIDFVEKYGLKDVYIGGKYLPINYILDHNYNVNDKSNDLAYNDTFYRRNDLNIKNINELCDKCDFSLSSYISLNPNTTENIIYFIKSFDKIGIKSDINHYFNIFIENDNCSIDYIANNTISPLINFANIGICKYIKSIDDINYIVTKNNIYNMLDSIIEKFIVHNLNFKFNKKIAKYNILNVGFMKVKYSIQKINYITIRISKIFE